MIADWAATEITVDGRAAAPVGVARSSSTPAGSTCGRCGSSARCAASTPTAARCGCSSERIVSLADRHVGAVRLELAVEDGPGARVQVRRRAPHRTRRTGRCRTSRSSRRAASATIAVLHSRTPGNRVAVDHALAVSASARRLGARRRARDRRGHVRPGRRVRSRRRRGAPGRPVRRRLHRARGARCPGRPPSEPPGRRRAPASTRFSTPIEPRGRRPGTSPTSRSTGTRTPRSACASPRPS